MYVQIIFNCACPQSLITEKTAELLRLTQSNEQKVPVKGFLDKEAKWLVTSTVAVSIPDAEGTFTLQTMPEIASNVHSADHNEFLCQYPQYSHLQFAHKGNDTESRYPHWRSLHYSLILLGN